MPTLRPFRDYDSPEPRGQRVKIVPKLIPQALIMNTEAPKFASMSEVVMKKEELLQHLITNKAKHDVILATAIAGYWDTAQQKLDAKQTKFYEQLGVVKDDVEREFKRIADKIAKKEDLPSSLSIRAINLDTSLDLVYPQDHSQDYERAIRMMQSSVFDQVRLTVEEYDAYVLNNWEWKQNFLATNTAYFDVMRRKGAQFVTSNASVGSYDGYQKASQDAINLYSFSGCSPSTF